MRFRNFASGILLALAIAAAPCAAQTSGDEIVAVLEKQVITARDLDFFAAELRIYEPDLLAVPLADVRKLVFTDAVEETLLWRWADTQLKPPTQETIDAWVRDTVTRYEKAVGGATRMDDLLDQSDIDRARFVKWLQDAARRRIMIREAIILHSDAPAEMPSPTIGDATRLRLAHIFVRKHIGTGAGAARERVLRVRRDVEARMPFAEAARLYSEDEFTSQSGGELGWLERAEIGDAMWNAIKGLSIGDVSAPVETPDGIHVLQVLDAVTPAQEDYLRKVKAEETKRLQELRDTTDMKIANGFELQPVAVE